MRSALLKNFSFLTISNLLMPIASMALVVAISRFGGVEMLGEYSFLLTFFFIGQTCSTAGLHIIVTRDVAREHGAAGVYFASACMIGVSATIALSLILLPVFMFSVSSASTRLGLLLTAATLLPSVVITFGESVLLAYERAADFVIIELVEAMCRAAIATALVMTGYGIIAVSATILACRLVTAGGIVFAMSRHETISWRFDRERFRELARQVPIVGAIPVVNALYWRADTLLLTWLRGLADVGLYGAATRILDVTRSIPQAYARALYPQLARLHSEDLQHFQRLCRQSLTWVLAGTVPIALVIAGLADPIISLLYGTSVAPAANALRILAWVIVPYTLTNTLAQILFASGHQAFDLKVNLIATTMNILLNLALIPQMGYVGASFAALCTMILHVSLQYGFVRGHVVDPALFSTLVRVGAAGAAAFLAVEWTRSWSSPMAATIGIATYSVGLRLTGIVTAAHIRGGLQQLTRRTQGAGILQQGQASVRKEPA